MPANSRWDLIQGFKGQNFWKLSAAYSVQYLKAIFVPFVDLLVHPGSGKEHKEIIGLNNPLWAPPAWRWLWRMERGKKPGNFMNTLFVQQDVLINSIIKNFIFKTTTPNPFSKKKKECATFADSVYLRRIWASNS